VGVYARGGYGSALYSLSSRNRSASFRLMDNVISLDISTLGLKFTPNVLHRVALGDKVQDFHVSFSSAFLPSFLSAPPFRTD